MVARHSFVGTADPFPAPTAGLGRSQGYRGVLVELVGHWTHFVLEIVSRSAGRVGFHVQPKRWIVERSLAWVNRCWRLSKDHEQP